MELHFIYQEVREVTCQNSMFIVWEILLSHGEWECVCVWHDARKGILTENNSPYLISVAESLLYLSEKFYWIT